MYNCHVGLRFTGVLKTATKGFPQSYLASQRMNGRGASKTLLSDVVSNNGEEYRVMATVWVNRKRHYFISSARSSVNASLQERIIWRQDEDIVPHQQFIAL